MSLRKYLISLSNWKTLWKKLMESEKNYKAAHLHTIQTDTVSCLWLVNIKEIWKKLGESETN